MKTHTQTPRRRVLNSEKVHLTLNVDKGILEEFKVTMRNLRMSISEFLDEMMRMIVDIDKSKEGGEVCFGILPKGAKKEAYASLNHRGNKKS